MQRKVWLIGAALGLLAACAKGKEGGGTAGGNAGSEVAQTGPADPNDPCNLVSQSEAEVHLGPLAHPPFRTDLPGQPDPKGKYCKYLAQDGWYIVIEPDRSDGKIGFTAVTMMSGLVGNIFTEQNGKTDTLEGVWDKASWQATGQFFALKGDQMVTTDISSGKGGVAAAADLSSRALARMGQPLSYNSGAATASAPKPRETGDACGLLTSAEVEAVLGAPLEGTPTPDGHGTDTGCTYHVKGKGDLALQVSWRHGFEHFAGGKLVMGTVSQLGAGMPTASGSNVGPPKQDSVKTAKPAEDPGLAKMMGVLQKLAKTQGIAMNQSGGLVQDTLVSGPWAEGAILGGMSLVAVKHDVQVTLGFRIVDPEQARALMAKIMEKL
jgi:hypothetical protein